MSFLPSVSHKQEWQFCPLVNSPGIRFKTATSKDAQITIKKNPISAPGAFRIKLVFYLQSRTSCYVCSLKALNGPRHVSRLLAFVQYLLKLKFHKTCILVAAITTNKKVRLYRTLHARVHSHLAVFFQLLLLLYTNQWCLI